MPESDVQIGEGEVLDLLASPAVKSLWAVDTSGNAVRYRLLETLRQ